MALSMMHGRLSSRRDVSSITSPTPRPTSHTLSRTLEGQDGWWRNVNVIGHCYNTLSRMQWNALMNERLPKKWNASNEMKCCRWNASNELQNAKCKMIKIGFNSGDFFERHWPRDRWGSKKDIQLPTVAYTEESNGSAWTWWHHSRWMNVGFRSTSMV